MKLMKLMKLMKSKRKSTYKAKNLEDKNKIAKTETRSPFNKIYIRKELSKKLRNSIKSSISELIEKTNAEKDDKNTNESYTIIEGGEKNDVRREY